MGKDNIYDLPLPSDPVDEACEWLAKIDRKLSTQEEKKLQEWLVINPSHPAVLMEIAGVWDKMDSLSKLADLFPNVVTEKPVSFNIKLAKASLVMITLIIVSYGGGQYFRLPENVVSEGKEQVFQTAIGEQSTVNLIDGTQLILNTNSIVKVDFLAQERRLFLKHGEIYVKVAHDKSRPLNVYIGNKVIKAVGTEFNIKITDDQRIELIVTEGKVLVTVIDKNISIPDRRSIGPVIEPDAPIPVSSGESVLLSDVKENNKTEKITPEDIEVKLSWRGGNLVFHGESLEEALDQIERYTRVEFIILDDDLKKLRIAGHFKAGDVEGLLKTLRENFDITYKLVNNEKVILTGTQ